MMYIQHVSDKLRTACIALGVPLQITQFESRTYIVLHCTDLLHIQPVCMG